MEKYIRIHFPMVAPEEATEVKELQIIKCIL